MGGYIDSDQQLSLTLQPLIPSLNHGHILAEAMSSCLEALSLHLT
ncbi:hypothetical protein [Leptolyngbya sp. FACHB-671]|nr:hypothetical protein [Leptolyngbya sp. FACHB-671]